MDTPRGKGSDGEGNPNTGGDTQDGATKLDEAAERNKAGKGETNTQVQKGKGCLHLHHRNDVYRPSKGGGPDCTNRHW